jgi:hypothetical protein
MQSYCTEGGAPLVIRPPHRKFCSNRCKMKNFRRGQSERLGKLECLVNRLTGNEPKVICDLFAQGVHQ